MPRIHTLDPEIVAKTAAGEVVERPASVVKELIENSLDAHSQNIKIELEESGIKKILIIDDGEGMEREDVLKCFKPHTTSKIQTVADLFSIGSLGFRGEALNSISAVSRLTIKSRPVNNNQGTEVNLDGGKLVNETSLGMPVGTVVEVRDLFFNTPARKKFLKSGITEFRHILEIIINNAIAYPKVGFWMKHNKKVVLNLPKKQTLEERIKTLIGQNIFFQLIPLRAKDTYFEISGYISTPQLSSENQRQQFLFVNNRCVKNSLVAAAVKEAYKTLLEPRTHPTFIIFLEIPLEMVDVNIHPRKEEVAFHREKELANFIQKTVYETLEKTNLTYVTDFFGNYLDERADPYTFNTLKDSVKAWSMREEEVGEDFEEVLQIHNLYLLAQTKRGLLLIDQHAAHERILYEQFLDAFKKQNGISYDLEESVVLELSLPEIEVLNENLDTLMEIGFELEEFGKNAFKVCKVPVLMKEQNIQEIIKEILGDLAEGSTPREINKKSLKTISYLACRSAIKAGEYLSPEERKKLIKKLAETKTSYTCPHGRPVRVEVPLNQLAKVFKRVR